MNAGANGLPDGARASAARRIAFSALSAVYLAARVRLLRRQPA
jgi:hypothetical protein